jgi:hypothetical protein
MITAKIDYIYPPVPSRYAAKRTYRFSAAQRSAAEKKDAVGKRRGRKPCGQRQYSQRGSGKRSR